MFFKGLVYFKKLIKSVIAISFILLAFVIASNIKNMIDNKIYEKQNKIENRTVEMVSNDTKDLIDKYHDTIESYEIEGEKYIVIFKTVDAANSFIDIEDYPNRFSTLTKFSGGTNQFLINMINLINIVIIVIYIILFVLIIILTLNYLNKIIYSWKLYIFLGYKNKRLNIFYFSLFFIIYSLIYSLFLLIAFMFTKYLAINIIIYIIIAISLIICLLILDKYIKGA